MKKVINIGFQQDFLQQFTQEAARITDGFKQQQDVIIFSHRRLLKAFIGQDVFVAEKKYLLPRCLTYSSIIDNVNYFAPFCQNIGEVLKLSLQDEVINNDTLTAILHLIVTEISELGIFSENDDLDGVDIKSLKRAVLEYYHYEYQQQKFFAYNDTEKLLLLVIEYLDKYLAKKNATLHAKKSNIIVNSLLKYWDYQSNRKIILVLPQTDSHYINSLLDHITKFDNLFVFIRGYNSAIKNAEVKNYYFHIANFLERNKLVVGDIENIDQNKTEDKDLFVSLQQNSVEIMPKYNILAAKDQFEEASLISLLIREKLAEGMKEIYVQTNSKSLAMLIESNLQVWQIAVDNLFTHDMGVGNFYLRIVKFLSHSKLDYNLLIDILKDRYCRFANTEVLQEFELQCLRKSLYKDSLWHYLSFVKCPELKSFITNLAQELDDARNLIRKKLSLKHFAQAVFTIHQFLAANEEQEILDLNAKLKELPDDRKVSFRLYNSLVQGLLAPSQLAETREYCAVKIVQIFETRSLELPFLIFAGLNEGSFPAEDYDHNFISAYTRKAYKLRQPEIELGYMQYDFINAVFHKNIVFSYSQNLHSKMRQNRWLEMITDLDDKKTSLFTQKYKQIKQILSSYEPCDTDELPQFALEQHTHKISVSGVEMLIHNPFIYYCRYLLKLRSLEAIARPVEQRDFGELMHELLFLLTKQAQSLEQFKKEFRDLFDQLIDKYHLPLTHARLWQTRIYNICENIFLWQQDNFDTYDFKEINGEVSFRLKDKSILLNCRADLIQQMSNNDWQIIDFKSGYIPTNSEVTQGLYPQLPLESIILQHNCFKNLDYTQGKIALFYIDVSGKIVSVFKHVVEDKLCESTVVKLFAEFFQDKQVFFLIKDKKNIEKYKAYHHFARLEIL